MDPQENFQGPGGLHARQFPTPQQTEAGLKISPPQISRDSSLGKKSIPFIIDIFWALPFNVILLFAILGKNFNQLRLKQSHWAKLINSSLNWPKICFYLLNS